MSTTPNEPVTVQAPYPLAMVICDAIWRDPGSGKRTILGCFSVIHAREFPAVSPLMAVYDAITDGRGKVPISLALVDAEDEQEPLFHAEGEVDFSDPRAVVEAEFHLQGLTFPAAGEYRFQLRAAGEFLIERRLVVVQIPGGQA